MKKKELSIRHIVLATMHLPLLQFLIDEGVLCAFLNNCEEYMPVRSRREIRERFYGTINRISYYPRVLNLAWYFIWEKTDQGHNFWDTLDLKYYLL